MLKPKTNTQKNVESIPVHSLVEETDKQMITLSMLLATENVTGMFKRGIQPKAEGFL